MKHDVLMDELANGHEYIPVGPCDNFDFEAAAKGILRQGENAMKIATTSKTPSGNQQRRSVTPLWLKLLSTFARTPEDDMVRSTANEER